MFDYKVSVPRGKLEDSLSWCRKNLGVPNNEFKVEHTGVWKLEEELEFGTDGYSNILGWEIHFKHKSDYTLFILSVIG